MISPLRSHSQQSNKRRLGEAEPISAKKQKHLRAELRLEIPPLNFPSAQCTTDDDPLFTPTNSGEASSQADSLFDEETILSTGGTNTSSFKETIASASCTAPPIPGFFFNPAVEVSEDIGARVLAQCMETYFQEPDVNQIMLFGRAPLPGAPGSPSTTSFPPILNELLAALSNDLRPHLPPETYDLLFPIHPHRARQAIINLYHPGEGISSHVDLLGRFGDGIIGVSFGSGCVMQFDRVPTEAVESQCEPNVNHTRADATSSSHGDPTKDRYDLYLPERSVIVLSGDSRYKWAHGIARRAEEVVGTETLRRGTRMSITFRWLLPGAEIVGGTDGSDI